MGLVIFFFQFPFRFSFIKMATFQTLFGESSHGKRKMWAIRVEDREDAGVIITEHGYENGKKVVNERVVSVGKNIGKRNETTPVQQATSEAQSAWNKKKDAGYAPEGAAASGVGDDASSMGSTEITANVASVPLPMLAQDFNKRGKSILFPCLVQRKLDGVRCVATVKGLYSRNGKAFPHMHHIKAEVRRAADLVGNEGLLLDGELYSDSLTFQEIVGLVKKEKLKSGDEAKLKQIHLCIYDVIDTTADNEVRNAMLAALFASNRFQDLRLLGTELCESKDKVGEFHARYVAEGYEGLMLRNRAGKYRVGVRSTDLQKYKEFEDGEYQVIGYKEGDGLEKGCVIWLCKTAKGQEFSVRPRGTHEARAELLKDADFYIGKQLTVRYQELTTDGLPRFPVGISLRDYE